MKRSLGAILTISIFGLGVGLFFGLVSLSAHSNDWWPYFLCYALPPMLIGIGGISFLFVNRRLTENASRPVWAAMALLTALEVYAVWFIYDQVAGFGVS